MPTIIDQLKKKVKNLRKRAKKKVSDVRERLGIGGEGKGTILERARSRVQELRRKVEKRKGKVLGETPTGKTTPSTETKRRRGL